MKKQNWLVIGLIALVVLGSASGWVYDAVKTTKPSQAELYNLQLSFTKQYPTGTVEQMITPKIYEFAWKDSSGNTNVSVNIGGVWVEIASNPVTTTP